MQPLTQLVSQKVTPERARTLSASIRRIDSPGPLSATATAPKLYEVSVFNFLFANKTPLGIREVYKCQNVRIDGLLELVDGRRVGLEIKYKMDWEKACQACAQIGRYVNHYADATQAPIDGAIVVFEEFAYDWARYSPSRLLENGWNYWYTDHDEVDGLPVHLVRLRGPDWETYSDALAAAGSQTA